MSDSSIPLPPGNEPKPPADTPAELIPPPHVIRERLEAVCREARLLRRLLQLSRDAGSNSSTGEVARA
jgi:hypothetical protein